MTTPWQEIPAWPFVVPAGVLVGALLLNVLHRRAALNVPRTLLVAALCVYGAGVVANTLFPIFVGKAGSDLPWWEHLNVVPLAGTDLTDMAKNVLVLLPLGFFVPLLTRAHSAGRALIAAFSLSLAIETSQVIQTRIGQGGHVGDVNDLLANCLGGLLGYLLFRASLRVPALERLATATTWPARSSTGRTRPGPARASRPRAG